MSFQLAALLLYRSNGDLRRLDFRPGTLNIITGASKTGKSSIIDIIDYCFASTDFNVSAGVIRDSVAMFGVVLQLDGGGQTLVARPKPPAGQATTSAMHLRVGDIFHAPDLDEISPNTETGAVRSYLSGVIGVGENLLEPNAGSRRPLAAGIRHALFFSFQGQGEVANRDVLFHSQADEWVPQAMRDVFPFFLGAVDRTHILKRQRLRTLARELRQLRRELNEDDQLVGTTATSLALVREAIDSGLVPSGHDIPTVQDEALSLLAQVVDRVEQPTMDIPDEDEYLALLDERDQLRRALGDTQAELRLLAHVLTDRTDFGEEAGEHAARLASLDLLGVEESEESTAICPVCASDLDAPVPIVSDMRDALAAITKEIGAVRRAEPRVQEIQGLLETRVSELKNDIRRNAVATEALEASRAAVASFRDEAVRRAAVRGRIGLYLETAQRQIAHGGIRERVDDLEREIASLEEQLDAARTDEKLASILSRINHRITEIARELDLEHSGSPIRLDLHRLTVVADTVSGPVTLSNMGSGENWLGYHVATLLALHEWFLQESLSVPRFLLLDQPSQVYFPADASGNEEAPDADEDRVALGRVMKQLARVVENNAPGLQLIVLDHADLQEPWFQESVVERWRDGRALIPSAWLE